MKGAEVLSAVIQFLAREQRTTVSALHGALGIPEAYLKPAVDYLVETGRVARIKAAAKPLEVLDDHGLPLAGPVASCGSGCSCGKNGIEGDVAELLLWKG